MPIGDESMTADVMLIGFGFVIYSNNCWLLLVTCYSSDWAVDDVW